MPKKQPNYRLKVLLKGRTPVSHWVDQTPWPKVGVWTKKRSPIICVRGWHLYTARGLREALDHSFDFNSCTHRSIYLYLAEGRGAMQPHSLEPKESWASARLVKLLKRFTPMEVIRLRNSMSIDIIHRRVSNRQAISNILASWGVRVEYLETNTV